MTEAPENLPDLVGQPDLAKMLGTSINTIHSWRAREDYGKLRKADVVVSGTPFWLKQHWTHPDKPVPTLPPLVGVKEVAAMFDVEPDTVTIWFQRDNGAPRENVKIGRTRIWTIPPWEEFARRTGRPINASVVKSLKQVNQQ
ncbi:hypothetical protein AB0F88_16650 [Streptosporangium sp. NPDC023963]|uniref:hypothetical protein n=1 Tax=Streptosporangium sp. NPDC023963 TaxID=3155608 RepID=UPI00344A395E